MWVYLHGYVSRGATVCCSVALGEEMTKGLTYYSSKRESQRGRKDDRNTFVRT